MNNLKNNIELLSPVGNFECLKAAVQNGADSVYFGAETFSARASASNFSLEELKTAIEYAKIRNVKTNLTLNTLIKNEEFDEAVDLARFAYENGIDAIIVQDLGLAKYLINAFPDLVIHASTQMTIHNLEGALEAEKLGFKRAVLSREVTLEEIKKICAGTSMEIEVFIHGALCISYSGQCLLSSMIGGRSGNRGRCAQPCRLPYKLTFGDVDKKVTFEGQRENSENIIDEGYLLSTRDLCGLEFIPELIKAGVKCFKIEGRMKPAEYVATVTKIYRKYIDLAQSENKYFIDENDKKALLQVFNRGGFSDGHFKAEPNLDLVCPEKPNNMGLFLGKVHDFNSNKGYITLKLSEPLKIGDTISLEKETGTYTVSELMINGINSPAANAGQIVKIGRMKGNISINNKIFKLSDKELSVSAKKTFSDIELKKIALDCSLIVKQNKPISITVTPSNNTGFYKDIKIEIESDIIPVPALNSPITKERISSQLCKTGSTPYEFKNINIDLDDNLYIPSISCINELRRSCIDELQKQVINKNCNNTALPIKVCTEKSINQNPENLICVLLNILNLDYDYGTLNNIDKIYIPFKFFLQPKYSEVIASICNKFSAYIYMPIIFKNTNVDLDNILDKFKINGFVVSNISHLKLLDKYKKYDLIANYSLNIFNINTIKQLSNLGLKTVTISPELDKICVLELIKNNTFCNSELIVYGKTPVMNINYCVLGKSNKCYSNCSKKCSNSSFYLRDRIGLDFQVIPDNTSSVTTIYNSKTTSISPNFDDIINFNKRIDFIDENLNEMQNVINTVISGDKLEGREYTNGSFNRITL